MSPFPHDTYIPEEVKLVREFYTPKLLHSIHDQLQVKEQLHRLADRLWEGLSAKNPVTSIVCKNFHPETLGKSVSEKDLGTFTREDARLMIAREYGWPDWNTAMKEGVAHYNMAFESAVDHFLYGRMEALEILINLVPAVLTHRSRYGHRASLLHYAGANGIELWRQIVSNNLPDMVRLLIDKGADPQATMPVYGDHLTVKKLLQTSDHAKNAGIISELIPLLN